MLHTIPDIACHANRAGQVSGRTFAKENIKELNDDVKLIEVSPLPDLCFPSLGRCTVHIRINTDASYATNDYLSSQLGYVILLCDNTNVAHVLHYSSKESHRVVRSMMAGELCSFKNAFDVGYTIAKDIGALLGFPVVAFLLTDPKKIFDSATKERATTERGLVADLSAARESYEQFKFDSTELVKGKDHPADGLSKTKDNNTMKKY